MNIKQLLIFGMLALVACTPENQEDIKENGIITAKVVFADSVLNYQSIIGYGYPHPDKTNVIHIEGTDKGAATHTFLVGGNFIQKGKYLSLDSINNAFIRFIIRIPDSIINTYAILYSTDGSNQQKGHAEVTIHNENPDKFEGTFKGVLYNIELDSIIIEDGNFSVQLDD